jgi:hypothetical protein
MAKILYIRRRFHGKATSGHGLPAPTFIEPLMGISIMARWTIYNVDIRIKIDLKQANLLKGYPTRSATIYFVFQRMLCSTENRNTFNTLNTLTSLHSPQIHINQYGLSFPSPSPQNHNHPIIQFHNILYNAYRQGGHFERLTPSPQLSRIYGDVFT